MIIFVKVKQRGAMILFSVEKVVLDMQVKYRIGK